MTRIVAGVDGSAAGRAALDWALPESVARAVPLLAVRAWLSPAFGHHYPEGSDLVGHESESSLAAQHLALRRCTTPTARSPSFLVETEVVTGHAAAVLLEMTRPGDVLVVGSRGRGGFRGLLMGSTSTQCAQHTTCPVVVVPDS